MVAQIEQHPREGVELSETLACVGCYWLTAGAFIALVTGRVLPIAVALVFALLVLRTPKAGAPRANRSRRRRRLTRAGTTAAVLVGTALLYFGSRL